MTFAPQSYTALVENTFTLSQDAQLRESSGGFSMCSRTRALRSEVLEG